MKEKVKFRQYLTQGESLYNDKCSNCHREDGNGLIKLMPPLTSIEYFKENREKLACIIKNGMTGKLEINGVSFDEVMPANPKLTNLQIAEVLTYIGNSWGHKFGIVSIREGERSLKDCATPQ
jgi:mono/diheme cytochrome c family protein